MRLFITTCYLCFLSLMSLSYAQTTERSPLNSPHPQGLEQQNVIVSPFQQRSPKTLDPALSYSGDEGLLIYQIYEPLYHYHYLKRPYQLVPNTATSMPEITYWGHDGQALPEEVDPQAIAYSLYTIHLQPGIVFQPHPAFAKNEQGEFIYHHLQPSDLRQRFSITDFEHTGTRELTAYDYVYGIKRMASPRVVSPIFSLMADHIGGLTELSQQLKQADTTLRASLGSQDTPPWLDLRGFDLSGVQALDDHTLQFKIKGKYPQFRFWLAMNFFSPMPWEADRFYSQAGMAERNLTLNFWPVGTGPYMLTTYRENRQHILSRNPNFRGTPYPCEGEQGDQALGLLEDCGKPMPFVDQYIFNIEKDGTSLSNKFIQGYYDIPAINRGEYGVAVMVAMQDSPQKAELYTERKLQISSHPAIHNWYIAFNWLDPVVGQGASPDDVKRNRLLRQAISIAFNWEEYISLFEADQAMVAHGPLPPGLFGSQSLPEGYNSIVFDRDGDQIRRKSLDEAKQLLAQAGYPDGRDAVTGKPLVLNFDAMSGNNPNARTQFDWMIKQFAQLGIQLEIRSTDYNTFQEKMQKGVGQLFLWGWGADYPDPENFLFLLYGPHAKATTGGENASNYHNPEFDRLYERMIMLDDGPEREALIHQMVAIVQQDAAWMFGFFPNSGGVFHQWVGNAKASEVVNDSLQYMKVDAQLRSQRIQEWNQPIVWPLWLILVGVGLAVLPAYLMIKRREQSTALGEVKTND